MGKFMKQIGIAFGVLLLIGMIGRALQSPEERAAEEAASAKRKAQKRADKEAARSEALTNLPTFTAREMAIDYDANTVAADQKYKGKRFKVSGTVTEISTNIMGDPYVTMDGTDEFTQPQFAFDKGSANQLANVRKGEKLTLLCEGNGDVVKIPMSENCTIL